MFKEMLSHIAQLTLKVNEQQKSSEVKRKTQSSILDQIYNTGVPMKKMEMSVDM